MHKKLDSFILSCVSSHLVLFNTKVKSHGADEVWEMERLILAEVVTVELGRESRYDATPSASQLLSVGFDSQSRFLSFRNKMMKQNVILDQLLSL